MSEENAAVVRRFYDEVFNEGNLDAADRFMDFEASPYRTQNLGSFKQSLTRFFAAFPDLRVTLEEVISAGDKVVVRWTDRGTHLGEFLGRRPTGRTVTATGVTIFRFSEGKIVEQWTNWDTLSMMGQLGFRELPMRDLVGRLLAAQEEERRRVAYEVHDGLAQTAVAAHGLLEVYADSHPPTSVAARDELGRVLGLVQQVVLEARRVIAGLRPPTLDDFGLAAALRLEVEALREDGFEVEYVETLGDRRLPVPVETALFRVAQEALNNVRKHAGTTRVNVELDCQNGDVRLRVRDQGRGFETTDRPGGDAAGEKVGLYGMRERVGLLGGDLEIRSKPGDGTLVAARVPVDWGGAG